ncbi:heme-copper oxidase subunit III [Nodularia spumigena CS-584]|jgi:cytochrome c oxidase subunit III|uniref:Heme-copper oxidase subunit III n=1 Tax=Nodularia spumigena UHCC 0060 TaxID=3110300 RepID=A0ABU5UUH0_NODSP|nr:heme-copper oxidase subunit III [Nodularia spumigena]AHJ26455.1 Cytochrome c oxidase polypeptide III [Nodularia spumigena CCY9414]EAW47140.1 cytochrome c oxidase subunit III [Nodularia spumigena CCY9414]MDB9382116.1 heme-copper oxidase subunit III [Nodularia spumigena CS-584]MEA5524132.1 heme-copper oxidase subunit III [Nodularia spumigena UHCC 0143]MEA5609953.1 heme-copper oxidase subunit III [Nodularia spumigena UHCC 0060]
MDSSIKPDELQISHHHPGVEHEHDEEGNKMFGFIVFLLSESVIFLSFFAGYIVYKTTTPNWLPAGVSGLEIREPAINTVILVSSSFVIYLAERALQNHNLKGFRIYLAATMAMGSYFLVGQGIEWSNLEFGFTSGVYGGMFYLLTGFHGLHVFTGILLQAIIFVRSYLPGNYDSGHYGVNATSLFWHFVDVIWIVLFILIYLWQ